MGKYTVGGSQKVVNTSIVGQHHSDRGQQRRCTVSSTKIVFSSLLLGFLDFLRHRRNFTSSNQIWFAIQAMNEFSMGGHKNSIEKLLELIIFVVGSSAKIVCLITLENYTRLRTIQLIFESDWSKQKLLKGMYGNLKRRKQL